MESTMAVVIRAAGLIHPKPSKVGNNLFSRVWTAATGWGCDVVWYGAVGMRDEGMMDGQLRSSGL